MRGSCWGVDFKMFCGVYAAVKRQNGDFAYKLLGCELGESLLSAVLEDAAKSNLTSSRMSTLIFGIVAI